MYIYVSKFLKVVSETFTVNSFLDFTICQILRLKYSEKLNHVYVLLFIINYVHLEGNM